jgi:hypothetical protein
MQYLTPEFYNLSLESQAQVLRAAAEQWEMRKQQEQSGTEQLHGTSISNEGAKIDKTFRLMQLLARR